MENQTITTGATPAPVNNQPTDGAPNPFIAKHPFGKKAILALTALLVVGGVGAGVYLNMGTPIQGDPNEPPPSLSAAGGLKGSFVESLQGFLQYEAKDVVAFDAGKAALAAKFGAPGVVKGNAAVNYMTVNADGMTMADFVNNNSPVADKNLSLFLIYSAGQGGLSKGFHSYPVGPFGAATKEIKKDDLSKITLARNSGVVMISKSNGENYGVLDPSVAPTSSVFPTPLLPDDKSGWVLVSGNGKLLDLLGTNKDRVISAWGLKDPTTFEKVDLNTYAFSTYHVAWVNLLPKSAVVDPTPTAVAPKITSVTPKTAEQGQKAITFIVTGTDLGGAKVEFNPAADFQNITGLTVDTTSTSVKFIADIADAATPGLKEIKVTTAKGSVVDKSFEIKAKSDLPLISSITPVVAYPEDKFTLQIVGTNFKDATVLSLSTDLVLEPLNTLKISDDFRTITLDARVTKQAALGFKEIKVTTPKGSVTDKSFEVKAKALKPVITSLSATEGTIGTLVSITVTGENIADINDLRIGNVSVQTAFDDVSGKKLATFTLLDNVPVGSQDLVVVSPTGGTSEAKKFTIKAAAADPLVGKTVLVHYSADAGKTYTSQWFEAKVTKSTSSSFLGMKFTQYDVAYSNKIVKSADGKSYDIGAVGGDTVANVPEANIAVPGDARYFDAEKDLLAVARYGAESGWSVKYNKKNTDGSYAFTYLDDNTSKTTFNINNLYKILGAKTHLTAGETIKAVPAITSISVKEGVKNELIKLDMVGTNLDTVSSLKLGGVVAGLPASQTATTAHFEFFVNSTLTAESQKLEVINPSGSASVDFMVKEKAAVVTPVVGQVASGSTVLVSNAGIGGVCLVDALFGGTVCKGVDMKNINLKQWVKAQVTKVDGTDYTLKVLEGPMNGKEVKIGESGFIAEMKTPSSLKQYQKVIAKGRTDENIFFDAHVLAITEVPWPIKMTAYTYGYDDELVSGKYVAEGKVVTPTVGIDKFFVPLGGEVIDTKSDVGEIVVAAPTPVELSADDAIMADLKNIEIKFKGPEIDAKTGDTKLPFSFSGEKLTRDLYDVNKNGKVAYASISVSLDGVEVGPMVKNGALTGTLNTQSASNIFIRAVDAYAKASAPCASWQEDGNICALSDRYLPTAPGKYDIYASTTTPRVITISGTDKAKHEMKIALYSGTNENRKWLKDYIFDYQHGVAKLEIQSFSSEYSCEQFKFNCDGIANTLVDVIIKNTGTFIIPESERIDYTLKSFNNLNKEIASYNVKVFNKLNKELAGYNVNGASMPFPEPGKSVTVTVNVGTGPYYGTHTQQEMTISKVALFKGLNPAPLSESSTKVAPVK